MLAPAQEPAPPSTVPPRAVSTSQPNLDRCAKPAIGEKLSVLLHLVVMEDGLPDSIRVERSSGDSCVDDNAVSTVQRYRFRPATRDGKPVSMAINIQVNFEKK